MESGRGWLTGDCLSTGAFLTLLQRPGLRASSDGVLATKSERKMLASACLYSLYVWFICVIVMYFYGRPMELLLFFYLSSFFSSPDLSGRTLDVYHTLTHGVALVRI